MWAWDFLAAVNLEPFYFCGGFAFVTAALNLVIILRVARQL
jgi:hypothetical protein